MGKRTMSKKMRKLSTSERPLAKCGTWMKDYRKLDDSVNIFIESGNKFLKEKNISYQRKFRAAIFPHAGHSYSGKSLGILMSASAESISECKNLFIFGVCHDIFRGEREFFISPFSSFELNSRKVIQHNKEIYEKLLSSGFFDIAEKSTCHNEHSAEMLLPFLGGVKLHPEARLTLIYVRNTNRNVQNVKKVAQLLNGFVEDSFFSFHLIFVAMDIGLVLALKIVM